MPRSKRNPSFWRKHRVLVTGGSGFLGTHVLSALHDRHAPWVFAPSSRDYDLRDINAIRRMLHRFKPTLIIHLAAKCGGIGANELRQSRGTFFYDNAIMGLQLMEASRQEGIQKFVQVGTVCAYPGSTPVPFKEADLWNGYPEPTNAPYGLAKKMLLVQAQAYRDQYDFNAVYLLPANLYGPYDHFDLQTSHVIPALIRKVHEAKTRDFPYIRVWGTGKATREFLYAKDAAEGILTASERYNGRDPVNLGTSHSTSIKSLVHLICRLMKYQGKIHWETDRPDGQLRRQLDISRAKTFGFTASTTLEKGLRETIDWYITHTPPR